jgi:hypothetical protein
VARFYDVFPNPPQNAHLGPKSRVLFGLGIWAAVRADPL